MTDVMPRRMTCPVTVGRDEPRAELRRTVDGAVEGSSTVVLLSGEAGVGKSRVVADAVAYAEENGLRTLTGECLEFGEQVLPLAPIIDVLRQLRARESAADLDDFLGPSRAAFASIVPDLADGETATGGRDIGLLMGATVGLLDRLAADRPLLLVFEDLHWADPSSRDVFLYATRSIPQRVVLLGTYRSDELHRRHPLRRTLAAVERAARPMRIELEPLDEPATVTMIEELAGDEFDAHLADQIYRRSGGNPFYVEELAAVGGRRVPATLRDVLIGRAASVSDDAVDLLAVAAAGGAAIDAEALSAVTDRPADSVRVALDELVRAGVLTEHDSHREFRHELAREVFEDELLPGDRAATHRAYATWLEETHPGRSGECARHWELGGELARALPAAVEAGRAAAAVGASPEAQAHYERALDLWSSVVDAEERVGASHAIVALEAAIEADRARDYETATELSRRAAQDLESVDPEAAAAAWARTAAALIRAKWTGEDDAFAKGLELTAQLGPSKDRGWLLALDALNLARSHEYEKARLRTAEAVDVANAIGDSAVASHALGTEAVIRFETGQPGGRELQDESERLAHESGDAEVLARAYVDRTHVLNLLGEHRENVRVAREGFEAARTAGVADTEGEIIHFNALESLVHLGEWEEAERVIDSMRRQTRDDAPHDAHLGPWWSQILVARGETELADAQIETVVRKLEDDCVGHKAGFTWAAELDLAGQRGLRLPDFGRRVDQHLDRFIPYWKRDACALIASAIRYAIDQEVPSGASVDSIAERAQRWIERVRSCLHELTHLYPDTDAWFAQAEAEYARLVGAPTAEAWIALVKDWDRLEAPYRAAYARYRAAEATLLEVDGRSAAVRSHAAQLLRVARSTAEDLSAKPMLTDIDELARRARLALEETDEAGDDTAASPYGLTEREQEVLALVAEGCSNGEIGKRLFIATKTASVHVSNILRKLDASNRMEAADIARREGLV